MTFTRLGMMQENNMNQSMTIIMGPAGSGKTTLALKLWRENNTDNLTFIYEADQWMVGRGGYKFDHTKLAYCHNQCQTNTERALFDGHSVIVSNTTLRRRDLNIYLAIAEKYKVPVRVIRMMTRYKSVHDVPDHKVKCMEMMMAEFDWSDLPDFVTVEEHCGTTPMQETFDRLCS